MWDYAVFGLDLSDAPRLDSHLLVKGINAIAKDFNSSGRSAFDTSRSCAVCGGVGHNLSACPALQDSTKVKEAYIRLRVALNRFLNSTQKLRDGNGSASLSTLSAIGMPTLEQISALHQQSASPPRPMLTSGVPNATTVVVSTLQGINQQLQAQGQQLSSLTAAITNLSSLSPRNTVDDADDTDSTGGTNESILAFLNAQKRSDFHAGRG